MPNHPERCVPRKKAPCAATANLIITCEHGGNQIPAAYRHLFHNHRTLLGSHRGFDAGALVMAKALVEHFGAPLVASTISRLLVDLNRSIGHRALHMESVHALPAETRQEIIERYYQPYRTKFEQLVVQGISQHGRVIHISCHSFTNNFNGVARHADVGLLYDPARQNERTLCAQWKYDLKALAPNLEVRRNFPYEGRNDGFTSALRKRFSPDAYLGIELELNQKHLSLSTRQRAALRELIIMSLDAALRNSFMTIQPSTHQHNAGTAP